MHEAQKMNLKLSAGSSNRSNSKKQFTYNDLVNWINNKSFDPYITEELLKMAKNYTSNYETFRNNYQTYISRIHKKRKENKNI